MGHIKQIRFCGVGGQGVVLSGTILGHAAIHDEKWVYGADDYGAQARGGSAESEVIISNHPIMFPHVIEADMLVSFSQGAYDKYIQNIDEKGALVIYDDHNINPRKLNGAKQIGIPSTHTAIHELHTKQVANIITLGALAGITGIVSKDALIAAISANVPERYKKVNLKALEIGFNLGIQKQYS